MFHAWCACRGTVFDLGYIFRHGIDASLHDDMTSAPAHLDEPVLLKDATDFASRQDAKFSHVSIRSSLQIHRSYSAILPPLRSRRHSAVTRLISAPNLNLRNFAGPTEARYERMSERDEIARERELQKDYERIWLPAPVKHSPGADRNRVDCDADRSASALHRPPWPRA